MGHNYDLRYNTPFKTEIDFRRKSREESLKPLPGTVIIQGDW